MAAGVADPQLRRNDVFLLERDGSEAPVAQPFIWRKRMTRLGMNEVGSWFTRASFEPSNLGMLQAEAISDHPAKNFGHQ